MTAAAVAAPLALKAVNVTSEPSGGDTGNGPAAEVVDDSPTSVTTAPGPDIGVAERSGLGNIVPAPDGPPEGPSIAEADEAGSDDGEQDPTTTTAAEPATSETTEAEPTTSTSTTVEEPTTTTSTTAPDTTTTTDPGTTSTTDPSSTTETTAGSSTTETSDPTSTTEAKPSAPGDSGAE